MISPLSTAVRLAIAAMLIAAASSQAPPTAYTNHTVGGNAGWLFNSSTNTSAANYSTWAASETFNLGDYLIFNTNSNQTVIQTFNQTTFDSCVTDDAPDNGFFVYDAGTTAYSQVLNIAVPLTIQGPNYFFSDLDDGFQCQHGMAFEIQVKHGLGLPPSLNQPPPAAVHGAAGSRVGSVATDYGWRRIGGRGERWRS